jgi:hypothetical protein
LIEVTGDLWTYPADVRIITTNGTVKKNGECVMGRGCAKEAVVGVRGKCGGWPGLPSILGAWITADGNIPCVVGACVTPATGLLVSMPVKHEWMQQADPKLIVVSATTLMKWADLLGWKTIVMPKPGCGNGRLSWHKEVRHLLIPILDDRFHVITWK